MPSIPASLGRVSNLLTSQVLLSSLQRTNVSLLRVQNQLASGQSISQASDDAVRASAIVTINDRLSRADQRSRNLSHAGGILGALDTALRDASDLVNEARSIASSQIGLTSDATTRAQQATVVDGLLRQMLDIANRQQSGVHLFGGSTPGSPPVSPVGTGGYRYTATGAGLLTDLGTGFPIPITLGGDNAIGETSARQRSALDLNPSLTAGTRLSDVAGARGLGIAPGSVSFSFNGGPAGTIDLTQAASVQDAVARITAAIRQYESDNSVTVLGAGGVSISGGSLTVDVAPGGSLAFFDTTGGTTGVDLGLTQAAFTPTNAPGADLNPRLTALTPLSALPGLTLPLGTIRVRMTMGAATQMRDVDLSTAQTVDDVRNLIEGTGLGVRVRVNSAGTGLDIVNEVAGPAMSIEEVGGSTAAQLGIRTLDLTTPLSDFNNGRGVGVVNGSTDPVTGLPDPARDVDFTIRLGNGNTFSVDLRPQDLANVQTLLARINAQAAAAVTAGQIPAGSFNATLTNGSNGIALQDLGGLGPITVARANNSTAADDLGLLDGTWDAGSATLIAQDRAGVRVNNIFTHLLDLRDALVRNDSAGITLAGEQLGLAGERVLQANGLVGSYGQTVQQATDQLEDQKVLDTKVRSDMQGLDYSSAAIEFSLLQTQLQASLQTAATLQSRTLFDFLG